MKTYIKFNEEDTNILIHYGTKGMHWGKRLYQNKDGSLTAAGRQRYGYGLSRRGSGLGTGEVGRGVSTNGQARQNSNTQNSGQTRSFIDDVGNWFSNLGKNKPKVTYTTHTSNGTTEKAYDSHGNLVNGSKINDKYKTNIASGFEKSNPTQEKMDSFVNNVASHIIGVKSKEDLDKIYKFMKIGPYAGKTYNADFVYNGFKKLGLNDEVAKTIAYMGYVLFKNKK